MLGTRRLGVVRQTPVDELAISGGMNRLDASGREEESFVIGGGSGQLPSLLSLLPSPRI